MLKKLFHYLIAYGSYWYYGRPARQLIVIGVTGTKGKSITCRYITSVLEAGGFKVGLLSTVDMQVAGRRILNPYKMTMLGRGRIQKILRQMVKAGCQYAVIETSSEGILQYRHVGLNYDIAVFTNLGTEHSERHGGFDNLRADKGKLFSSLHPKKIIKGQLVPKVIIANGDDQNAEYFLSFPADQKWICGLSEKITGLNALRAVNIQLGPEQTMFKVNQDSLYYTLNIIGKFNIYNALSAIAVARSFNISAENIAHGLAQIKMIDGRMEFIKQGQEFKVVVDYAHEPLSYTELFNTLKGIMENNGRLIAIIGSDGGGRDKSKRKIMGEIAGRLADVVIITDVNCFDEDPVDIADMLAMGARQAGKIEGNNLIIQIDRKLAIETAFRLARKDDIVAITAKGAEPCLVVKGGNKIPWDDREICRALLKQLKK